MSFFAAPARRIPTKNEANQGAGLVDRDLDRSVPLEVGQLVARQEPIIVDRLAAARVDKTAVESRGE